MSERTEPLLVQLDDFEVATRASQLATAFTEHDRELEAEKDRAKDATYARKAREKRIRYLARVVSSRLEEREVPVKDRPNFAGRVMETVRLDTHAIVSVRPLNAAEMTGDLFVERASDDADEGDAGTHRH